MPLRILIADDHPLVRSALAQALAPLAGPQPVIEATSFASLTAAAAEHPDLDLALLDLNMPGAQGFSSLVFLRGERPELPVIVVSSNDHPRTVRRAQQFGAAGFVPKSAPLPTILQAASAVIDGGEWFPAAAERSEEDAKLAARLAQLTPQQFRVLMCIADGLLNKQIAHELGMAENTVKVHVTAILRKLDCYSRTQAAMLVGNLQAEGGETSAL